VIDDASTDATPEILNRYEDEIIIITHDKNQKLPKALNNGIRKSRGKFLVRLDNDDVFEPELVEREAEVLEKNKDICFVYPNYWLIDEKGVKFSEVNLEDYDIKVVHDKNLIATGTMIRKNILNLVGLFDERLESQEMYDLYLRLVKKSKGFHLDERLFSYRRRPGQMTGNLDRLRYYTEVVRKKHNLGIDEVVKW
jgi:glycosyltransferase involved in cell wall biosynthesis